MTALKCVSVPSSVRVVLNIQVLINDNNLITFPIPAGLSLGIMVTYCVMRERRCGDGIRTHQRGVRSQAETL